MLYDKMRNLIVTKESRESLKDPMCYMVWEDGEVTITKAGELLWQRNIHMMEGGEVGADKDLLDVVKGLMSGTHNGFKFIPVQTREDALEVSGVVREWLRQ